MNWSPYVLANSLNFEFRLTLMQFYLLFHKEVDITIFHEFFYQIKDKINLKAKT